MTLSHIVLHETVVLLAIPAGIFLIAFLVALVDFIYARLFIPKSPKDPQPPPFLQNLR